MKFWLKQIYQSNLFVLTKFSVITVIKLRFQLLKNVSFKLLQQHNDSQSEQMKKENDILKSQIEILNSKLLSHQDQDDAIMNQVEARIKEFRVNLIAIESFF